MNLQENYRRLFKGKPASNDGSILLEARYNVKVADHRINPYGDEDAEKFEVLYKGTITGPDIPNGTTFEADGVAGDIDNVSAFIRRGADMSLHINLEFPDSETSTSFTSIAIHHANSRYRNRDETDPGLNPKIPQFPDENWDAHLKMTKAKKDEISKMIDDAVVKYALSKGLEAHVAEKSGGTFNKEVAKNAKKKKTGNVVVDYGEVDGRDRTASGTYGNKKWELETDDGMTDIRIDGKPIDDDDPMYDAILTAVTDEGYELEEQKSYKTGTAIKLQENYRRLFKGKPASNDGSILFEARYNIKVNSHTINPQNYKGIDSALVQYGGTIDGADIPKGTSFEARGVAGDVDEVRQLDPGTDMSLKISLYFPESNWGFPIYHANDAFNENADYSEDGWDEGYPLAFTAKAKQDEISKMIDDAVVKYALSKGLEAHVAEKSGGTFNKEVAKNLKKRKKKSGLDKDAMSDVVMTIADDAGGGRDMTDDIIDELGDFYDDVYNSNDQKLIDAYDDLRSTADGEPNEQAEAANKLLDVIG